MFGNYRRNKLRNRVIWAAIGVCIMTFGIWLNYTGDDDVPAEETTKKVEAEDVAKAAGTDETKNNKKGKTGTVTEDKYKSYLIKEVDGVVKVYLCDGSGNRELHMITTIPFELLSESDQNFFEECVELDTEEELCKFLENFDS